MLNVFLYLVFFFLLPCGSRLVGGAQPPPPARSFWGEGVEPVSAVRPVRKPVGRRRRGSIPARVETGGRQQGRALVYVRRGSWRAMGVTGVPAGRDPVDGPSGTLRRGERSVRAGKGLAAAVTGGWWWWWSMAGPMLGSGVATSHRMPAPGRDGLPVSDAPGARIVWAGRGPAPASCTSP